MYSSNIFLYLKKPHVLANCKINQTQRPGTGFLWICKENTIQEINTSLTLPSDALSHMVKGHLCAICPQKEFKSGIGHCNLRVYHT